MSTLPSLFCATLCYLSRSLRSKRFLWFRSKERPRNGIFGFDRARNGKRVKNERGGRRRGRKEISSPSPLFTRAIFHAFFDSRSLFFAPKLHGNACLAGQLQRHDQFVILGRQAARHRLQLLIQVCQHTSSLIRQLHVVAHHTLDGRRQSVFHSLDPRL